MGRCRCLGCRAANAAYVAGLRRRHLRGLPVYGVLIEANEAWALIRSLVREMSRGELAKQLGQAKLDIGRQQVRLKTYLRLRRIVRKYGGEGPDRPLHDDGPESA